MAFPLFSVQKHVRPRGLSLASIPKLDAICSVCYKPETPRPLTLIKALYRFSSSHHHYAEAHPIKAIITDHNTVETPTESNQAFWANSLQWRKLRHPRHPPPAPLARKILEENWGYTSFRLEQEAVISRLIDGGSAVAVFPTGSGKSLLYQIAALGFDKRDEELGNPPKGGITLVVSPLIALIKDQTQDLLARGIPAASIVNSDSHEYILDVYGQIKENRLKLLYCAPERLNCEAFVQILRHTNIRMVAVDEAHCVFEWGDSFRPDYLKVPRFVKEIGAERVLCVTATATQEVAVNICSAFGVPHDGLFRSSSYRPNLRLLAEFFQDEEERLKYLIFFLEENPGATIIYVITRTQAEFVAQELVNKGFEAIHYHAGMHPFARNIIQDRFMQQENITIVATIAFGLGINKPDIRNIIHYGLPRNLEAYSQEIGRAGRDGKPSRCMILASPSDSTIQEHMRLSNYTSKRNIHNFFKALCQEHCSANAGDIIEASLHAQSKDLDIGPSVLRILYSRLELHFGLLRELSAKYSPYTYKPTDLFDSKLKSDKSLLTQSIIKHSTGPSTLRSLDINRLSTLLNTSPDTITGKLYEWDRKCIIDLRCTGFLSQYRLLQALPQNPDAAEEFANSAYKQMSQHRQAGIARSQQVLELIGSEGCFSQTLAEHFGDVTVVPREGCKNCRYCLAGEGVDIEVISKRQKQWRASRRRISAVLSECPERSDPELLAKVALGVKSPKIIREKYPGIKVFGSMADCDFDDLVKKFSKHCKDDE